MIVWVVTGVRGGEGVERGGGGVIVELGGVVDLNNIPSPWAPDVEFRLVGVETNVLNRWFA